MTRIQTPQWMSLACQILEGQADASRNPINNLKTQQITMGVIKTLMSGIPLSPQQADAFIKNIQKRIPGRAAFAYAGEIVLTDKQIKYARSNPAYADVLKDLEETTKLAEAVHLKADQVMRKMEYMADCREDFVAALNFVLQTLNDIDKDLV